MGASQVAAVVKNLPANAEDMYIFPGLGRSPGGGYDNPLHILAWRIPWTEEPGRLQSIGSQTVGHDWSDLARMHIKKKKFGKAEVIIRSPIIGMKP